MKTRMLVVGLLVVVMLVLVAACTQKAPEVIDSQSARAQEEFKTIQVKGLSDLRGAVAIGGSETVAGAASFGSTASFGGAATFNSTASFAGAVTLSTNIIHSSTSITPTDGGTLTPTAKLVTLTPAGAVGIQLGACTTGNETILYNSINANVVITDTGNGILAGNATLGQYDALMLACFSSKWVQVSAVSAN